MRKDLEERLFAEYPRLYSARATSRMSEGFACGDGWFDLIRDLSARLEALGNPDLVAFQVKEKLGSLRFNLGPGAIFRMDGTIERVGAGRRDDPRAAALIREAQEKSYRICETCGAEGRLVEVGPGVQSPACADHAVRAR